VAAALALRPQALPAAAVEGDGAVALRSCQGFGVHVTEHEHAPAGGVLHHRGDEALAALPVELGGVHARTSKPRARSSRLSAGMRTSPEWKTLAASAASTSAAAKTAAKSASLPAPPEATSGTSQMARAA